MPARQIRSLPDLEHGHKHREHRSKKGRRKIKYGETKSPEYLHKLSKLKERDGNAQLDAGVVRRRII